MDVAGLIDIYRNPGDDGIPDTFADDLETAHGAMSAKIEQLTEELQAANTALSAQKAANYDLLMAVKANEGTPGDDPGDDDDGDEVEGQQTIDDLYEDED